MSDNDSVFALIDALKARYPGFQVVGTTAHHEKTLSEVDFTKPTMLLIGNETEACAAFTRSAATCSRRFR